ncbi:MAG: hypothetical protein J6Z22_00670, partial [Lachnospiraceae bacterium]|nr:hypothetical protein [Lachnospiraceae bacterium]
METDDGYYYNQGKGGVLHSENQYVRQALTYHEKASGNEIFLCNKPECNHDGGNDCEATYKSIKVDNSVLYDESIYVLGTETEGTMVSVNLYKAALDGSAKIYCSKSVTFYKFDQAIDSGFIIHNGNAYVTYFLQFGEGSSGLKGAGLCRMSLEDGIHFVALDAKTGQVMEDEEIVIHNGEGGENYGAVKTAFLYDGKLFVGFENVACFYDLKGNLLGKVQAPLDLLGTNAFGESLLGDPTSITAATLYRDYKISNGNLYFLLSSQAEIMMDFEEMIETGETYYWQN